MQTMSDLFYEFHSERVISRAGQPIETKRNIEIGAVIGEEAARRRVQNGGDVYTLRKTEAKALSESLYGRKPGLHTPHAQTYYQHFHPGQESHTYDPKRPGPRKAVSGPGHVYFGFRGENYDADGARMREQERVQRQEAKFLRDKVIRRQHDKTN